jgi:hypothetical protein
MASSAEPEIAEMLVRPPVTDSRPACYVAQGKWLFSVLPNMFLSALGQGALEIAMMVWSFG